MSTTHPTNPSRLQFITNWQSTDATDADAILAFWRREGAFNDEATAAQRLREIVLHARTDAGDVVAVCTAVAVTPPQLNQPMYYYRCFVGKDWRATRLVSLITLRARQCLEDYARAHAFPCIGIMVELENERFRKTLRAPVWQPTGFIYIGKSARGLDLRVYYFRGARLK